MRGMSLSVVLLIIALAGILGGGWLAGGLPGLGGCLIFDSLCVGAWALLRDDGARPVPSAHDVPTLAQIFDRERARAS